MIRTVFTNTLVGFLLSFYALPSQAQDPLLIKAQDDPDFVVQGEYLGPSRGMQVIALGDGDFEAVIYEGGLPGQKWNGVEPRRIEMGAEDIEELSESNEMKKVLRKSPTLGAEAPPGAVVLFDGSKDSLEHWEGGKFSPNKALAQGTTSKQTFQDFSAHIEFRTPYKPEARGQARGNSGIYYQGRYETQVLDSFGLEGKNNETGGIYSIRDPDLNMCFPPLTWQTYDVDFTAARFDKNGKKTKPGYLTVRLNGVVVQQNVKLTKSTTAAKLKEGPEPGPIYLQDHGNPVEFRNIWVLPRDADKEALRPIIPGYERLYAGSVTQEDKIHGGKILWNELNCASCHKGGDNFVALNAKQAPILNDVGSRIRPDYLFEYLKDPHAAKPGSTMPQMLTDMDPNQRETAARALTSFLMTTGKPVDRLGQPKAVSKGDRLFHEVGCTACHEPQNGTKVATATSISLSNVSKKYTLDSLTQFLQNPHAIRPSGRMPKLVDGEDALNVATYLLQDVVVGDALNTQVKFYKGTWDNLPDFDQLEPVRSTKTFGFDIKLYGKRLDNFGARFDSFLQVNSPGKYRFHLASDDGSRIYVDGKLVVNNDGVHGVVRKSGEVELATGTHAIRVEFFEKNGGEEIDVEVEGPDLKRMPLESLLTLDPEGKFEKPKLKSKFEFDPSLVATGRQLFTSRGCANCHELKVDGKSVAVLASGSASGLEGLHQNSLTKGCLSVDGEKLRGNVPNYDLNPNQRESLRAILTSWNDGG